MLNYRRFGHPPKSCFSWDLDRNEHSGITKQMPKLEIEVKKAIYLPLLQSDLYPLRDCATKMPVYCTAAPFQVTKSARNVQKCFLIYIKIELLVISSFYAHCFVLFKLDFIRTPRACNSKGENKSNYRDDSIYVLCQNCALFSTIMDDWMPV